jgi:hypothetical protein
MDASLPGIVAAAAGTFGSVFATLAGPLPTPPTSPDVDPRATLDARLRAVLELQADAGIVPLTDAGALVGLGPVDAWRRAGSVTDRPVKAILRGPYSAGGGAARATRAAAIELRATVDSLAAAGCPLVQVDEPAIADAAGRAVARRRFVDAHQRLVEGAGTHLSLALLGPAEALGADALFELAYPSYLFDLVGQPDDWRVIARAPRERGIICGVVPGAEGPAAVKEVLVWAAQYAASLNGRGLERVGLATTGSLAGLDWSTAVRRVRLLGEAARIAADDSPEHLARELDPRALGIRAAALGPNAPRPPRRRRPATPAKPREDR